MASIADRNRAIFEGIKKGDIAVTDLISDGGYLPPEEEGRFFRKVYQTTPFLNSIRKVPMAGPQRKIHKIGISDDFLHVAPTSGTALDAAKRSKVFTESILMTTSEVIGVMYLPYDVIEDNIERGAIEDTLMNEILPAKVGRALERMVIQGSTISGDTSLSAFDGVIRIATTAAKNIITFDQNTGIVTDTMFEQVLETMPDAWRENETTLSYVFHRRVTDAWWSKRRLRQTPEGDSMVDIDHLVPMNFRGTPIMSCGNMPKTNGFLTNPMNVILGMQRGVQFETARDIEARVIIIVCTMRPALAIEEAEAFVLANGLNPAGTSSTT